MSNAFPLFTNLTKEYVFAPINVRIKVFFATANIVFGVLSLIANSLILYFSYKKPKFTLRGTFSRQKLIECYIQSLALTDVLCALISLPIFTTELFVDFIKTDLDCAIVRTFTMYFPIATVYNYLTIGRERYLAVHKPFEVPSVRVGKRLVVAAWLMAGVVDVALKPSYKLVHYDLGNNSKYTHTCKYDHTSSLCRNLFASLIIVGWVVPCVYLTVTNFLTLKFLRQQHSAVSGNFARIRRENLYRHKSTSMFVYLIFAFVSPYQLFFVYSLIVSALQVNVSFLADYSTRYLIGLLAYANGFTGASILFYFSNYYRRKLKELCHRISTTF